MDDRPGATTQVKPLEPYEGAAIARSLVPVLAAKAAEAEAQRRPVDEVMDAVFGSGLLKHFVPEALGGHQGGCEELFEISSTLAEGCTSTAWIVGFNLYHHILLMQFPAEVQREALGEDGYISAPWCNTAESSVATPVPGGFRLSGRNRWGSGITHANWCLISSTLDNDAGKRLCLVRADDVEMIDTWHVDGMAGTGSYDVVVEDCFVPDERAIDMADLATGETPGSRIHGVTLHRFPIRSFYGLAAGSPAIGAARTAVRSFEQHVAQRTVKATQQTQATSGATQLRLGEAHTNLLTAELLFRDVARDLDTHAAADRVPDPEQRLRHRLQIAQAVGLCRDLIAALAASAGSSVHVLSHPLQRALRDVNTLSGHGSVDRDTWCVAYGRHRLGLDPGLQLL